MVVWAVFQVEVEKVRYLGETSGSFTSRRVKSTTVVVAGREASLTVADWAVLQVLVEKVRILLDTLLPPVTSWARRGGKALWRCPCSRGR